MSMNLCVKDSLEGGLPRFKYAEFELYLSKIPLILLRFTTQYY